MIHEDGGAKSLISKSGMLEVEKSSMRPEDDVTLAFGDAVPAGAVLVLV